MKRVSQKSEKVLFISVILCAYSVYLCDTIIYTENLREVTESHRVSDSLLF
jgi:hypothetical protein